MRLFKHQLLITAISVFVVIVTMFGGSYAIFSSTSTADEYNVLKVGELEISYVDTGDGYGDVLSLNNSYPISDIDGANGSPYRFNITNTGTITADFKIKIKYDESIINEDHCEDNLLPQKYIKYKFDNNDPKLLGDQELNDYMVYEAKNLIPGSSEIHEIRIWIDESATNEILGKHFHGKVVVESMQSGVSLPSYSIGDSVTLVDNSRWHVIENSNSNSVAVTLLSDFNLKSDGSYDTSCLGTDTLESFSCDSMIFDDTSNNYDSSKVEQFIKNVYSPILKKNISGIDYISLPTVEQILIADKSDNKLLSEEGAKLSSDWLVTTNYWTKTSVDSSDTDIWYVDGYNKALLKSVSNGNDKGIRVVITTQKSNIKAK